MKRRVARRWHARRSSSLRRGVERIIAAVREGGDTALRELSAKYDRCALQAIAVEEAEFAAAEASLDPALKAAIREAAARIEAFHRAAALQPVAVDTAPGVRVERMLRPIGRVGLYVPAGSAPLPSTALMLGVPAHIAGCREVVLCSPARADGRCDEAVLYAARLTGVHQVFKLGGAQAIAAMAYGAGALRPVDVVVGPGNAFVVEAKRQVFGTVGIDGLAGASEVAIVADATADPSWVAVDLLAQAEHGPGGAVTLIVWDDAVAERVDLALDALLVGASRRDEARSTLEVGGRVVLVDDPARALDAANAIAPEHLELMCAGADLLVPSVRSAGAVFVGADAHAVLGDYVAGTNHVLPTGGSARFASALRTADFQKLFIWDWR